MRRMVTCAVLALVFGAAEARALTIASSTTHFNFSGDAVGLATGIRFDFCFKPGAPGVLATCQFLFGGTDPLTAGLVLTNADVGRTFVADANTSGFAFAKALVTNGVDDSIAYVQGIAPRSTSALPIGPESSFFKLLAGLDLPGPDLAGFGISAITLTVLDLNVSLIFTHASAVGDIRVDFLGQPIPEPGTAVLLGGGLLLFSGLRMLAMRGPRTAVT